MKRTSAPMVTARSIGRRASTNPARPARADILYGALLGEDFVAGRPVGDGSGRKRQRRRRRKRRRATASGDAQT